MKHTLKLILLILIAWTWLPTGPSDVFIIPWLINTFGMTAYVIISIILVIVIYKNIEGRGLKGKLKTIGSEIKRL